MGQGSKHRSCPINATSADRPRWNQPQRNTAPRRGKYRPPCLWLRISRPGYQSRVNTPPQTRPHPSRTAPIRLRKPLKTLDRRSSFSRHQIQPRVSGLAGAASDRNKYPGPCGDGVKTRVLKRLLFYGTLLIPSGLTVEPGSRLAMLGGVFQIHERFPNKARSPSVWAVETGSTVRSGRNVRASD